MQIRLQLGSHTDALKVICMLDPELLARVCSGADDLAQPFIRLIELQEFLSGFLDSKEVTSLSRELVALSALKRDAELSNEDIIEAVSHAINRSTDWSDVDKSNWSAVRSSVLRLLSSKAISVLSKGLDLSYDFTNLLETARVLTDLRPIFDDGASDEVVGAIVTQTLRIHYTSDKAENSHSISIAVDEKELVQLRDACDRALKKGVVLQKSICDQLELNSYVVGQENVSSD